MFYLIGLGLGNPKDITVNGLEIVKKCKKVFLESYTSMLCEGRKEGLEELFGCEVLVADRELVESSPDVMLERAKDEDVAFLVVGDPFGATTHTDIVLRARALEIPTKVIHNASIMNAVGATGLQLYSFGETVSIPYWTENWKPQSFYDKICENKKRGLHTLCLLDIKVKEPNLDALQRGRIIYDPPRFMSVAEAAEQLMEIISEKENPIVAKDALCIGIARVGSDSEKFIATSVWQMVNVDLGDPLHSLIIPGNLHPLEEEFIQAFMYKNTE